MIAMRTEAAVGVWFLIMIKNASINYSEYDPERWKVSFIGNVKEEDHGTESQEVTTEGLLDLSILEKNKDSPGAISGGKYYNSKNEDMSRASMNTEVRASKSTGLEEGVKTKENVKIGNNMEAQGDRRAFAADGDASSNSEDANATQDTPPPAADQVGNVRVQEE